MALHKPLSTSASLACVSHRDHAEYRRLDIEFRMSHFMGHSKYLFKNPQASFWAVVLPSAAGCGCATLWICPELL